MSNYQHLSPEERALIMIEYNQGKSIGLLAYCLMTNHIHLILKPN
ncbi:MAG: helix-turn-helix domain-containing protein [Gammaproteobacteria bacterium]|nr:helix-turn-helix domain-containing protein [Gammaproteobacteria bacterium]